MESVSLYMINYQVTLTPILFVQSMGDGSNRSVAELERVVSAMRKVVENLQREKESLKKTVSSLKQARSQEQGVGGNSDELEAQNKKLKVGRLRLMQHCINTAFSK